MSSFSRNTYDESKRYVSVRLQQGAPIIDADWNEADDIRRNELRSIARNFAGDGVPAGNDGFRLLATQGSNDFVIQGGDGTAAGAGRILVAGQELRLESNRLYSAQTLHNPALAAAWGVPALSPLTTPTTTRTDCVYLEVWEREVDVREDASLVNPALAIESCVRLRREWTVRVRENATTPPTATAGRSVYKIAELRRAAGLAAITQDQIVDFRATQLRMLRAPLFISNDRVGLNTANPAALLDVNGDAIVRNGLRVDRSRIEITHSLQTDGGGGQNRFDGLLPPAANGRSQLVLSSNFSDMVIASSQNHEWAGGTLTFAAYNPNNPGDYRKFVFNHSNWGPRQHMLEIGFVNRSEPNPHYVVGDASTALTIDGLNRRVGLGGGAPGRNPTATLDVNGDALVRNGLRVDRSRVDLTSSIPIEGGGGHNRFTGLHDHAASGRSQLVLSSNYSDLVIASSQSNPQHGSTLTFATYNPANVNEYRKFVVNQGNWGARRHMLDFGYVDRNEINPHLAISDADTTLTIDGFNKRIGVGAGGAARNPAATLDVNGDTRLRGTLTVDRAVFVNGSVEARSPDLGIYNFSLKRRDEQNRDHTWAFWHMNAQYGRNSLQIYEYKTDSQGSACGGNVNDGAMCNPRFTIMEGGRVGINTTLPDAQLEVNGDLLTRGGLRADRSRIDVTSSVQIDGGGGHNRFTGVHEHAVNGRSQLVLSSNYSDLVIASSQNNNVHGGTLTFATYAPGNANDYRKFVFNQGNWGSRRHMLEIGYADRAEPNPHGYINNTDTVMTIDGLNKRVGIGTRDPRSALDTHLGVITGPMNSYTKAQFTFNGGGNITWFNNRLRWTTDFLAIGFGRSAANWNGHIRVRMPGVGAAIPAANVYNGVARVVNADGIEIGDWEALYFVHSVGGHEMAGEFRILNWTTEWDVQNNWILIASRNQEDGSLRLGNGEILRVNSAPAGIIRSVIWERPFSAANYTLLYDGPITVPRASVLMVTIMGHWRVNQGAAYLKASIDGVPIYGWESWEATATCITNWHPIAYTTYADISPGVRRLGIMGFTQGSTCWVNGSTIAYNLLPK
jgi:hypothetical protein